MKTLAVSAVLVLFASQGWAAGFRLPEAGSKAMGMGFAFTAQADDPSAIYYNPAGMTQLDGTNVMAGVTYIKENGATFTGTTFIDNSGKTETQKDLTFFVPNGYVTSKLSKGVAVGVGVFSPFGLGQEYENRNTSIFRNQITKIDLRTIVVNPTIAIDLNEFLSIGAGIDFMYGWAKLDKTATNGTGVNLLKLHLEGDGTAWGYNFGLLLKPAKEVKVGFNYRSPFTLRIKDGDVTIVDNVVPTLASSKAETVINMPATAAFGVAFMPFEKLTVEADLDWTFWSRFRELRITNKNSAALNSTTPKNWKDTVTYRVGAEYRAMKALAVRLGYAYDDSPVPDQTLGPELPDSDRHNFTAGLGTRIGPVTADLSYFYLLKKARTVDNINQNGPLTGMSGKWDSNNAHLVALDLGYRF